MPKEKKKPALDALDLQGLIMSAYHKAEKMKVSNGPRYSVLPPSDVRKFKIRIPGVVHVESVEELVEEHFKKCGISTARFSNLGGEIVHDGARYFVLISVTLAEESIIDGTVKLMGK